MHNMTELEIGILIRVDLSELPCSWSSCDAPAKHTPSKAVDIFYLLCSNV